MRSVLGTVSYPMQNALALLPQHPITHLCGSGKPAGAQGSHAWGKCQLVVLIPKFLKLKIEKTLNTELRHPVFLFCAFRRHQGWLLCVFPEGEDNFLLSQ